MVITKIMGGLGNQLFQWANARSLEIDRLHSYIDISHYNTQAGITQRTFDLNKFPFIKYELSSNAKFRDNMRFINIADDFVYRNIDLSMNDFYLNGYWQSEKYFIHNSHQIRMDLSPDFKTQMKLVEKYPELLKTSVSLHVRRGDYVNQQQNHPVQPIEYYIKAIEQIGDYDKLYVFSDDIEWCKNNLKFDKITFVSNDSDLEDLWHMALCSKNIIANSSFSWWGAWLNTNPNKVVIAPSLWFGDNLKLSTNDLIPDSWIKI